MRHDEHREGDGQHLRFTPGAIERPRGWRSEDDARRDIEDDARKACREDAHPLGGVTASMTAGMSLSGLSRTWFGLLTDQLVLDGLVDRASGVVHHMNPAHLVMPFKSSLTPHSDYLLHNQIQSGRGLFVYLGQMLRACLGTNTPDRALLPPEVRFAKSPYDR